MKLNKYINSNNSRKSIISDILLKSIVLYFKNLTYSIENKNIQPTGNKIENIFQKVFLKPINLLLDLNKI